MSVSEDQENPGGGYSVIQLAQLAGIRPRTLRYLDSLGLIRAERQANGYRRYGRKAVLRLQQILFFREFGLDLAMITEIIDQPDFDFLKALNTHRENLASEIERMKRLLRTVDKSIRTLDGLVDLPDSDLFIGFANEEQIESDFMDNAFSDYCIPRRNS